MRGNRARFAVAIAAGLLAAGPLASAGEVLGATGGARTATPLNGSVMIMNEWGLLDAVAQVEAMAARGHRRVNFLITLHARLDEQLRPKSYGMIRAREGWEYAPFDAGLHALYLQRLRAAFAKAAELKLDIAILPHLDAAGPVFGWRNEFDLDPLAVCEGYSYRQLLIDDVVRLLEETVPGATTSVELAMMGEMGRTVFAHPEGYLKILDDLRGRTKLRRLEVGISLNFNKVAGGFTPAPEQRDAVRRLIAAGDFVGLSCYGEVSVPPAADDFSRIVSRFVADMEKAGAPVPPDKPLHFSEVGIGGGGRTKDYQPLETATTPEEAARAPWSGPKNPDDAAYPWKPGPLESFRRDYYRALLDFLHAQRTASAHRVTAAFMWNAETWCPYGWHRPDRADPEISRLIREHNAAAGAGAPATQAVPARPAPLAAMNASTAALHGPVRIETGLLEGVPNPERDVVAFKGIPYAAPPVGNLRWREPQPPAPWEGVRKADRFGASCTQPPSPRGKQPAEMSEDCLYLNVWTPAKSSDDKRAVLFFIHGGAGIFGSGNLDGAGLARKGIVVVTMNYRLGLFSGMGHPGLTAESPHHTCGTYGMLDLIAALRWVQANLGAFGGDPAKVTLAGHSSGAGAMHYLITSPVAKGLFRGAIGMSFPSDYLTKPNAIPFVRQKEENGVTYAKVKKCTSLDELRKLPALELIANDPAVAQAKLLHLGSGAARDGWAFPLAYADALERGLASDVPTLTGITVDDFGPPAPYLKTTVASFAASLSGMFGENRAAFEAKKEAYLALCPVTTDQEAREMMKRAQIEYRMSSLFYWAKRRAKTARTPVYTYLFDQAVASERGAYHGSDLAYAFNDLSDPDRAWTAEDRRVADQVSSYWVNFVNTGNPNGETLPEWAPFRADSPSTMTLGTNSGPRLIAEAERLGFYRELLDK